MHRKNSPGLFVITVLVSFVFAPCFCVVPAPTADAVRILHFPNSRVGVIQFVSDVPFVRLDQRLPATLIARGDVKIPPGKAALLSIEPGGMEDLSFLMRLKPDDIAAVALGFGWQGTDADDKQLESLTCLTGLRGLDVKRSDVTDKGISSLLELKKLEWLCLRGTLVTASGVPKLAGLRNLCSLDLSENRLRGTNWRWLSSEPRLAQLTLGHCTIRDEDVAPIFLPNLTFLKIDDNPLTDKGLSGLSLCKKLTYLNLSSCAVGDQTIKRMATLTGLQALELNGCKISAHQLKILSKLKLQQLTLGETTLDDNAVEILGSFKGLIGLYVSGTKPQEDRLKKLLPHCQVVHITPLAKRHPIMDIQQD